MLEAMGFTHDTLALLQHKGWDALLQARRQARRTPLRMTWPWSRGQARSPGASPAASLLQREASLATAEPGEPEVDTSAAKEAGALGDKQRAQELEAVLVLRGLGADTNQAATGMPSVQLASAPSAQQQSNLRQSLEPGQRRLASQPSRVQRLLRHASMLGSGRRLPPGLEPCPSARGPVAIDGAATPLDALALEVGGAERQTDNVCT